MGFFKALLGSQWQHKQKKKASFRFLVGAITLSILYPKIRCDLGRAGMLTTALKAPEGGGTPFGNVICS